jgi:PAS domain-containing protein
MSSSLSAGHEFGYLLVDLVEQISDYAIYSFDRNGVIRTWNEGARALFGDAADAAIGSHFSVLHSARRQASGPRELPSSRSRGGSVG